MRGPYNTSMNKTSSYGLYTRQLARTWYRTDFGGDRVPLPFGMHNYECGAQPYLSAIDTIPASYANLSPGWKSPLDSALWSGMNNRLYDKLREEIHEGVNVACDLAEGRQTWQMIGSRLVQLRRAFGRAIRLDVGGLARVLGVQKKKLPTPRDAASLWLEYHFGWAPLIQDVYDGMKVLSEPVEDQVVRCSVGSHIQHFHDNRNFWGNGPAALVLWYYKMQAGCKVVVENPNLALADRLGLVNPASVLWEITPWSFVVDWFIPIGAFIESWTDFLGLSLSEKFTTLGTSFSGTQSQYGAWEAYATFPVSGIRLERSLTLPTIKLFVKPLNRMSLQRGATAISLLVQQMKSLKRR